MAATTSRHRALRPLSVGLLMAGFSVLSGFVSLRMAEAERPVPFAAQKNVTITGGMASALAAVVEHRKRDRDLRAAEKDLRNFDITIESPSASGGRATTYFVLFGPRLRAGEERPLGGKTSIGRELAYEVSSIDFKILNRLQMK